jgi:hypothetical protein
MKDLGKQVAVVAVGFIVATGVISALNLLGSAIIKKPENQTKATPCKCQDH